MAYHIILILKGECRLTIKHKIEKYTANNLIIIPFGIGLSATAFSNDFHGIEIIPCDELILDILRNRNPFPGNFRYKIHSTAFSVVTSDEERDAIISDMKNLMEIIGKVEHNYIEELSYAYFYILLTDISNILWTKYGGMDEDKNLNLSRSNEIFKNFFDLLRNNIRVETKIGFYADKLCISSQYLSIIVKNNVNMPIGTFILNIRYEIATRYLLNSSLSIQQIASSMNFTDQSAFGKFFKKKSGLSPKAYRKSVKKNLLSNLPSTER